MTPFFTTIKSRLFASEYLFSPICRYHVSPTTESSFIFSITPLYGKRPTFFSRIKSSERLPLRLVYIFPTRYPSNISLSLPQSESFFGSILRKQRKQSHKVVPAGGRTVRGRGRSEWSIRGKFPDRTGRQIRNRRAPSIV